MKEIHSHIFEKIEKVAYSVNKKLRNKGFVVPIKNSDGTISYGNYKVIKNSNGSYDINENSLTIVQGINLIHSASLLANKLAISRVIDDRILYLDKSYGSKLFEAVHYRKLSKKVAQQGHYEKSDILQIKSDDAEIKSKAYKQQVLEDFDKLLRSAK